MKLKKDKVKLFVRIRPIASSLPETLKLIGDKIVEVTRPGLKPLTLVTDGVMTNNSQKEVYHNLSKLSVIKNLFEGYSTCILSYGVDTAGKSFTLFGCAKDFHQRGLIVRFISSLYEEIQLMSSDKIVILKMSAICLCGDNIYDLLAPEGLNLDRQTTVHNFTTHIVTNELNAYCFFLLARTNKAKLKKLLMNKIKGEWSHFIFTITVEIKSLAHSETKVLAGKLKFVELAGAVGELKEPVTKEQLIARETISILEHDLVDKHSCPDVNRPSCRRCKLSFLLKDVICGHTLFILILSVRVEKQFNKSLIHTIMFGQRLLHIEIKAEPTLMADTFGLKESLQQDVENLKLELYQRDILANRRPMNYGILNDMQKKKLYFEIHDFLNGRSERIKVYTQAELQTAFEMVRNIHKNMQQQNELQVKFEKEIIKATFSTTKISQEKFVIAEMQDLGMKKDRNEHETKSQSFSTSRLYFNDDESKEFKETLTPGTLSPTVEEGVKTTEEEMEEAESEQISELPSHHLEAFEEFKSRPGKHLNETFLIHKALTEQKKIEFNRLLHDLRETKQELAKALEAYHDLFAATRDPTTSEELAEMMDKLEVLKQQSNFITTAAISALGEVRASQKIGHEKRQHLLKEFDLWYEKKLSTIRFKTMLGSKDYQIQGSAMLPKKSHRKPCQSIGVLSKSETKFREAKIRIQNWVKHSSANQSHKKCITKCEKTFDFLSIDDSD